jgi:hypothetical protein
MHTTNPALHNSAEAIQLNIFGGSDEIFLNEPRLSKETSPGPSTLHDGAMPPVEAVKPVKPKLVIQSNPACAPGARAKEAPVPPELLVDPDESISVDLEAIEASDTPETIMAKRMFLRMMWDIEGKSGDVEPDLFGQTSLDSHKTSQSDLNRLDALIWLYSLNPDGSLVSIEWVCDVLGFDPHRVRRIVGRSLRKELKRLVHLLSTMVGAHHAQVCEDKISDYLDISNWSFN